MITLNSCKQVATELKDSFMKNPMPLFWVLFAMAWAIHGEAGAMMGCIVMSHLTETEE